MESLGRGWRPGMLVSLLIVVACEGENVFGLGRSPDPTNGAVAGAVTADGTALGGVRVILVGRDSTETNSQGEYRFEGLPVGTYTLAVRVPIGFVLAAGEQAVRSAAVAAGGTASVNWRLQSSAAASRSSGSSSREKQFQKCRGVRGDHRAFRSERTASTTDSAGCARARPLRPGTQLPRSRARGCIFRFL